MTTSHHPGDPVTVVIPVFNRVGLLAEGVASVLAQDHELEIVIVDDGSTDGTSGLADQLAGGDDRIRAVHQPNAGPGAARNSGLRAARHRLVVNHDSDDLMLPGRLASQVACLAAHPGAGAVVSRAHCEVLAGSRPAPHVLRRFGDLDRGALCTMLVDRDLALAVGGYAEDRRTAEDVELLVQLHEAGHPYVHQDEVVAIRRLHGGNLSAEETDPEGTMLSLVRRHLVRGRVQGIRPDDG